MVIVSVLFKIKLSDSKAVKELIAKEVPKAKQVKGNVTFGFFNDSLDDTRYHLFEVWEGKDDFERYKSSDAFLALKPLFGYMDGPHSSTNFDATVI